MFYKFRLLFMFCGNDTLFGTPKPAPFTGVAEITNLSHQILGGMGYIYCVATILHSKCSVTEEVELTTSTQYVMSGSTLSISRVKGAVQVK